MNKLFNYFVGYLHKLASKKKQNADDENKQKRKQVK